MNLLEKKIQCRTDILKQRADLSAEKHHEYSLKINELLLEINAVRQAKNVFCFISYRDEVETGALIDWFLERNIVLAVPKIVGKTEMLAINLKDKSDLEPDKFGILTPKSFEIAKDPFDLVITPGVAFTSNGARLGYGRAYYDHWFTNNQVSLKIGIGFNLQVIKELPLEDTDVPLDMLITEKGIIEIAK